MQYCTVLHSSKIICDLFFRENLSHSSKIVCDLFFRENLSVITNVTINPVTEYDHTVFACNGYNLNGKNEGIIGTLRVSVKGSIVKYQEISRITLLLKSHLNMLQFVCIGLCQKDK